MFVKNQNLQKTVYIEFSNSKYFFKTFLIKSNLIFKLLKLKFFLKLQIYIKLLSQTA